MKYSLFKENCLFYLKINSIIFLYNFSIQSCLKYLSHHNFSIVSTIKKLICNCNHFHIALLYQSRIFSLKNFFCWLKNMRII